MNIVYRLPDPKTYRFFRRLRSESNVPCKPEHTRAVSPTAMVARVARGSSVLVFGWRSGSADTVYLARGQVSGSSTLDQCRMAGHPTQPGKLLDQTHFQGARLGHNEERHQHSEALHLVAEDLIILF